MRTTVTQDTPEFKPVRVEIVIETEAELLNLRAFLARDIIIPEALKAAGELRALEGYRLLYPSLWGQLMEARG